jgi:hypothetical protein
VDAAIDFLPGAVLALMPSQAVPLFGLPDAGSGFSIRVPGAVVIGIGTALTLEHRRMGRRVTGLGLGGAAAINLSGVVAVAAWLLVAGSELPVRGRVTPGLVVSVLVVLSGLELAHRGPRRR